MEMTDVTERVQRTARATAAGDDKKTPPQLEATIISVSQPGTSSITTPPVRPSTVPNLLSRTDKQNAAADSAAATRPKTTGTINNSKKKDNKRYHSLNEVEDLEQQEDDDRQLTPPLSPIDEQVLEEVLYNRPTLRLGREMSMKFRAQSASIPSRRRRVYKSLPHGAKRPKTAGALTASGVCVCVCVHIIVLMLCVHVFVCFMERNSEKGSHLLMIYVHNSSVFVVFDSFSSGL